MTPTVTICPEFDAYWYSCYLEGLRALFPLRRRHYSMLAFPECDDPVHFRCIVHGEKDVRLFIDAKDNSRYDRRGLDWCDIYAKVNLDFGDVPPKVVCAGPNFPMRLTGLPGTIAKSLSLFVRRPAAWSWSSRPYARLHFAGWHSQWRYTEPESDYRYHPPHHRYVFFAASLWKGDPNANEIRGLFVQACRSLSSIDFEGGFTPRSARDVAGFDEMTVSRRYSHRDFVAKSAQSAVVFNSPAVNRCHSFRLAEYLALGKAIVSTPLQREVPAPLVHGEHIHFVEPTLDSIREGVERIVGDPIYRSRIERGARNYYEHFLSPRMVMSRLLRRSGAMGEMSEMIQEEAFS